MYFTCSTCRTVRACGCGEQVRSNGELSIFEVNTRMGSDLGCDVPMPMLRELFRKLDSFWEEDGVGTGA